MNYELTEAYRAEVSRLVYPSLRTYLENKDYNKLNDLLSKLNSDCSHEEFPVISGLYNQPLESKVSINNININLIDEELVNGIHRTTEKSNILQILKKIIKQEIILMFNNSKVDLKNIKNDDFELEKLINEREQIKRDNVLFWDTVYYDFDDINRKLEEGEVYKFEDLQFVFGIVKSTFSKIKNFESNLSVIKFNCFRKQFLEKPEHIQRGYLIKLITELDYTKDTKRIKFTSGKNVLDFLCQNGLATYILESYRIHKTELSARLHLKLLEANIIKEDYENEFEREESDLKNKLLQEHLRDAKQKSSEILQTKTSKKYKIDVKYQREDAIKALKEFVDASGVIYLNKYLVDRWLIDILKIKKLIEIVSLREAFTSGEQITVKGENYSYESFEDGKHFLESKVVQMLRKDEEVKILSNNISDYPNRRHLLTSFLNTNKIHFQSYGCNYFIFLAAAIEDTADILYRKLSLYQNLNALPCHKIIIDAFKNFKVLIPIRYSGKYESYDCIGNLGGFANELKRLLIQNDSKEFEYKSSQELLAYLNKIISDQKFEPFEMKYDDKKVEIKSKEQFINFFSEFNDVTLRANRFFIVGNENTVRKQTALISANKKFNKLCDQNNQNCLKTIVQKYDKEITHEFNTENNLSIFKAGINGLFNPKKFKYDDTNVFNLPLSCDDFATIASKNGNTNDKIDGITTVNTLSLFELIQRFGYHADTGGKIRMINEYDAYKSYAYKYPHEYFAGPIKMATKIVDNLVELYKSKLNYNEEKCKTIRLWVLGHLFAAAQNDILDGKNAKLTSQYSEKVDNIRKYMESKKPTKHALNLKKYIKENIGQNKEGKFDDEQLKFIQTFFGISINGEDFDKIQNIISRVHMSVTLKNLENSILDSGRISLREFDVIKGFNEAKTTVYENLQYENENDKYFLNLSLLFKNYGEVCSIRKILELLLVKVSDSSSDVDIYISKIDFKKQLNDLITHVQINFSEDTKECEIKVQCKIKIKEFLIECMQKSDIEVESIANCDDIVLIKHKFENNNNNIKSDLLSQLILEYRKTNSNEDLKAGFINCFEVIIDSLEILIHLENQEINNLNNSETRLIQRYVIKSLN